MFRFMLVKGEYVPTDMCAELNPPPERLGRAYQVLEASCSFVIATVI